MGSRYPRKGAILGLKSIESQCCATKRSKKTNNVDSETAAAGCNAPDWLASHYIARCEKIRHHCDAVFLSKFFDHLLAILV